MPRDTPGRGELPATTAQRQHATSSATVARLAYEAEPAYRVLARFVGGEEWRWVSALRRLNGWDDSDWVRRVYEVRLDPD